MKIVRRLSDGLVQYKTTEPHELTDKYYKSDGVKAIDINNITHEVVSGVTLPIDYHAGAYAYNSGVWTVANQTVLDANVLRVDKAQATSIIENRMQVGEDIIRDFTIFVFLKVINEGLPKAQAIAGLEFFHDAMLPLRAGQMELAKTRVEALTPGNQDLIDLQTRIVTKIDEFLDNND